MCLLCPQYFTSLKFILRIYTTTGFYFNDHTFLSYSQEKYDSLTYRYKNFFKVEMNVLHECVLLN